MLDAMDAFQKLAAVATPPIILLFTKIDIFEELLSTHIFTDFFPDYIGPMNSFNTRLYLASMFQRRHMRSNKKLFIRVVNAAEPEVFRKVFEEIESRILKPWPESTAPVWSDGLSQSQDVPSRDRPLMIDDHHNDDGSLNAYSDYDDDPPLNSHADPNDDAPLNA